MILMKTKPPSKRKRTASKKIKGQVKVLSGFVLLKPNGEPLMFTDTSTRAIGVYAQSQRRIILDDADYQIEMDRLRRDGWSIHSGKCTVTLDD
jgi:hypothetical protein